MNGAGKAAAKALFGRSLRIALAEWICELEDATFFQQQAKDAMRNYGEANSGVLKELAAFVEFEMLQRVESERRTYYQRLDSPFWSAFQQISRATATYEATAHSAIENTSAE